MTFVHLARPGGGTESLWPLLSSSCYRKGFIKTHSNLTMSDRLASKDRVQGHCFSWHVTDLEQAVTSLSLSFLSCELEM